MRIVVLGLLLCGVLLAQRPGGVRSGGGRSGGARAASAPRVSGPQFGNIHGFGNVVYPGTGRPPLTPGISSRPEPPATTGFRDGGFGRRGGGFIWLPIGTPFSYPLLNQPALTPQQETAPTQVIINQNFAPEVARPVVREYETDGDRIYEAGPRHPEPPAEEPKGFLIALTNHTIYVAFTFWVDGDTLHYVTLQGTQNMASLDLVDVDLSTRLNRERNVVFDLESRRLR
ncbi:MAG: hypothetical protein IPM24_20095 [Bryobacterales bacterium]|nr:hypothetical protein [Bryobacterales bacterium]